MAEELDMTFSEVAAEMDRLILSKNYPDLKVYLQQLKNGLNLYTQSECFLLYYYMGTGYGALSDHYRDISEDKDVALEFRKWSFFYLREVIEHFEQEDSNSILLMCAYTNYANGLDSCGRVIEALRIYRKALTLNPQFGMALGNYGRALKFYADMVNDLGHYRDLHCFAYHALKDAVKLKDPNLHEDAIQNFQKNIGEYEELLPKAVLEEAIVYKEYDLGELDERQYRIWCLKNHLFLNPLNDLLVEESAFAHDPLTITVLTENVLEKNIENRSSGAPPKWFAMLNQLKEEYIFSRWMCYEGITKERQVHYADREVKLSLASYDYANYSIRLEQLKAAFKGVFSIFDKTSFVINLFWNLGFPERKADAAHVFKSSDYPSNNVALTALRWSYFEFEEKYGNADRASERELKILRNALEHKFIKIHEYSYGGKLQIEEDYFYHISENDLKIQTIRLLEIAREWLMELVYAIGIEESKNNRADNAVQLNVADFDDRWKV